VHVTDIVTNMALKSVTCSSQWPFTIMDASSPQQVSIGSAPLVRQTIQKHMNKSMVASRTLLHNIATKEPVGLATQMGAWNIGGPAARRCLPILLFEIVQKHD
jgi:hypothetical protein